MNEPELPRALINHVLVEKHAKEAKINLIWVQIIGRKFTEVIKKTFETSAPKEKIRFSFCFLKL